MAMPADVYSFSMLMLELWTGELIYKGVNTHQVGQFASLAHHALWLNSLDQAIASLTPYLILQ